MTKYEKVKALFKYSLFNAHYKSVPIISKVIIQNFQVVLPCHSLRLKFEIWNLYCVTYLYLGLKAVTLYYQHF